MIEYRCDYCGRKCSEGSSVQAQTITTSFNLTKKWKADHTDARNTKVAVLIGQDDTAIYSSASMIKGLGARFDNVGGHDLCVRCQIILVKEVLARLQEQLEEGEV